MARTAYDVNRRTRHLDIHKQFLGGLKTIDTDDALKSVYLREMKNLSLSEFGFIEKRYGIYKNDEFEFVDSEGTPYNPFNLQGKPGFIQGYFEYVDGNNLTHKLIFIDGMPFINDPRPGAIYQNKFRASNFFFQEPGEIYPEQQSFETGTAGSGGSGLTGEDQPTPEYVLDIEADFDYGYLILDKARAELRLNITPDIDFNGVNVDEEKRPYSIEIETFTGDFLQAVSQEDIERPYEVSVSPVFTFPPGIVQLDVERSYEIDITSEFTAPPGTFKEKIERSYQLNINSEFTPPSASAQLEFKRSYGVGINSDFIAPTGIIQSDIESSFNPIVINETIGVADLAKLLISSSLVEIIKPTVDLILAKHIELKDSFNQTVINPTFDISYNGLKVLDVEDSFDDTVVSSSVNINYDYDKTINLEDSFDGTVVNPSFNVDYNDSYFEFLDIEDQLSLNIDATIIKDDATSFEVEPPSLSTTNLNSTTTRLTISNPNNFTVVVRYSLTDTVPDSNDAGVTLTQGSSSSVDLDNLSPYTPYTVYAKAFRTADFADASGVSDKSFRTCRAADVFLGYSCSGTTKIRTYSDGNCGTYTTSEANSTDCGYDPTPTMQPPQYQNSQAGTNSIQVDYFNPNNTNATLRGFINTGDQNNVPINANSSATVTFGQLNDDTNYYVSAKLVNSADGWYDSSTTSQVLVKTDKDCPAAGTYLGYSCSGTTKIRTYADGNCGTYTTSETNSTDCGYVPPAQNCPSYGTTKSEYCVGDDLWREFYVGGTYTYSISECNTDTELVETNSTECGYTPPTPDQTESPTVNLSSPSGGLNVFIQNNDSSTVSLSYSGTATQYFSLPSTLGPGATFSDSTFIFPGTYNLCVTATASGEDASNQVCDTQTVS